MTISRLMIVIILGALTIWGAVTLRSPYRVALPFGSTDLSTIQSTLDRLPADERELVYGYVKSSNGDVLPPRFADPDYPLTARTVGEAIELQRSFLKKQEEIDLKARVMEEARNKALKPLRDALSIALVKREIVDFFHDGEPRLVTTYRVVNTSGQTIDSFKAHVGIMKAGQHFSYIGQLDECFIEHKIPLSSGQNIEIPCGKNNFRKANEKERGYVDMTAEQLSIHWFPMLIRFANGTELMADD